MAKYVGRQFVASMKKVGCSVCSEKDPACMDYHHIDPEGKSFSMSCRVKQRRLLTLLRESAKCVVLCSNCHRKHHYYGDYMEFKKPGIREMKRRLRHAVEDGVISEAEFTRLASTLSASGTKPARRTRKSRSRSQ